MGFLGHLLLVNVEFHLSAEKVVLERFLGSLLWNPLSVSQDDGTNVAWCTKIFAKHEFGRKTMSSGMAWLL